MNFQLKYFVFPLLIALIFSSCYNTRKLVTDEIVLKTGNSETGTITECDSSKIKIKKMDESISIIKWENIDTIQGKKLKTLFLGANFGYYNSPYFSVFRNQPMAGKQMGMQYKIGMAYRGEKLYYTNLTFSPARPDAITKFGFGYHRYIGGTTYQTKKSFFVGSELNFMNAKNNNGSQTTLEPFTGYEVKLHSQLRIHFKFQLQFNIANKNSQTGFNATIGIHFLNRNFKRQYELLNKQHKMYRK